MSIANKTDDSTLGTSRPPKTQKRPAEIDDKHTKVVNAMLRIEGVLAMRDEVIVVDELAHAPTNQAVNEGSSKSQAMST